MRSCNVGVVLLQYTVGKAATFWGVKRSLPCLLARPGDRDAGADTARGKAGKVLSGAEIFYARLLPALEARS